MREFHTYLESKWYEDRREGEDNGTVFSVGTNPLERHNQIFQYNGTFLLFGNKAEYVEAAEDRETGM